MDDKTRRLIKQTLTDTISKVKISGEISESFKIKTGVRQGRWPIPILFNIVLHKIIREWERELRRVGAWKLV